MEPAELAAILTAHAFLAVERPPELWSPDTDAELFLPMLGNMISAGLVRNGGELDAVTLNVSNVSVPAEDEPSIPPGEYVAVTIRGAGDWSPETSWPAGPHRLIGADLESAAAAAGAEYGYTRVLGPDEGSVTVLLPRAPARRGATAEGRRPS